MRYYKFLKMRITSNRLQRKAPTWKELASQVFDHQPYVGEYRQTGMVGAIELVKDKETKEPFPSEERVGYQIYKSL